MNSADFLAQLAQFGSEYSLVVSGLILVKDPRGSPIAEYLHDSSDNYWLLPSTVSNPPSGHFKVTNFYVNSATGKLVIEYDNTPAT